MSDQAVYGLTAAAAAGLMAHALCAAIVRRQLALDPVSERSSHKVPTPRLGGAAILGGLLAGSVILFAAGLLDQASLALIGLALAAGGVGLLDDLFNLTPRSKLILLALAAFAAPLLLGGVGVLPVPFIGWVPLPNAIGMLIAAFWVLSVLNVVNFMDGLNGLASSFAILLLAVAAGVWGLLPWPLLAMQLAIFGFLLANVFRGQIFLGDAGSLSLAMVIAAAPLTRSEASSTFWFMPLVSLPLILDVAITILRRAARGARLSEAHREHVYQQLKALGWSHQASSLAVLTSGLAALGVASLIWEPALAMPALYWMSALLIALVWGGIMGLMALLKRPPAGR